MKSISTQYSCGISTIFFVFLMSLAGTSSVFAQNRIIVNRSFETGPGIPHNDVAYLASQANPSPQIDGWYSTHPPFNGVNFPIEHWHTGFQGVNSQQGTYHVELNVTQSSRLYQIVYLVHGEIFHWEYFHRQRISGATETVQYSIYSQDGTTNLFIIDTHTSTNNTGWDQRSGNYTFNGASGIYQIGFESTTGGGSGNFLDNISIGLDALSEFTRSSATVVETNSTFRPYIKLNGEVNTASSITFQVTSTNAVEGIDYTFTNKTKQIAAGQYSLADSVSIDLVILNNTASNSARSLKISVSGVTGDIEFRDSDGNGFDSTLTITIIEHSAPGGVFGENLWLKGDAGVSGSSGNLTGWTDQTGTNTFTVSGNPQTGVSKINFNNSVDFDGTDDYLNGNNAITFQTLYAVIKRDNTGFTTVISSNNQGTTNVGYMMKGDIMATGNDNGAYFQSTGNLGTTPRLGVVEIVAGANEANQKTFIDGKFYSTQLLQTAGTFNPFSRVPFIGRSEYADYYDGQIAELIMYPASHNDVDRNKIQSYLAVKYGITLDLGISNYVNSAGTSLWSNTSYWYDVFGIGKDDASGLHQSQSNSMNTGSGDGTGQNAKGNIVLSNPSSLDNNDFLMIGNDNSALTEQTTDLPPILTGFKRLTREWKVDRTGDPGSVSLTFNLSGLTVTGTQKNDFILLIDTDGNGDFTNGSVIQVYPQSLASGILTFNLVQLPDGAVLTFVTGQITDFDGDGVADAIDEDIDNDGILNTVEGYGAAIPPSPNSTVVYTTSQTPASGPTITNPTTGYVITNQNAPGVFAFTAAAPGESGNGAGTGTLSKITITAEYAPNEIINNIQVGLTTGSFDDGLFISVDGVTIVNFNYGNYNFPAFNAKFGGANNSWEPWSNEGNPALELDLVAHTVKLMVDVTDGSQPPRQDALPIMNGATPSPVPVVDWEAGVTIGTAFQNQNGPGGIGVQTITFTSNVRTHVQSGAGAFDFKNLDSDDDGCHDVIEAGFTDPNGDGLLGPLPVTVNPANGRVTSGTDGYTTPRDGDANNIMDFKETGSANTVTAQPPANVTTSVGSNATIQVGASGAHLSYRWQVSTDAGATFTDVTNGGVYTGTTSNQLALSNVPLSFNSHKYRVIVGNLAFLCNPATSSVTELTVNASPGGVGGGNLWLKADAGTSVSGANLTGWTDQTGLNTFTVAGTPGYQANAINFKPGVTFSNTNGNTTLPAHRLDGNTSVTYVDGFAVYRSNTNQSTLIGSTVHGVSYGPALFSADGSPTVYVGNGSDNTYRHFDNPNVNQFGIANLDVSLATSPYATGRLNGAAQTMIPGSGGNFDNISLTPMIGGTNNNGVAYGWYPFNGQVAEMVLYPSSLSMADKLKVESYLAVKYGITLNSTVTNYVSSSGTVTWNNIAFWNDVFGIGKDDNCGLTTSSSNSINSGTGNGSGQSGKANIVISNPSSLDNNDFMMIGHDNGSLADQSTDLPSSLMHQCKKRFGREWKVKRTGDAGNVDVKVDFTGLNFSGSLGSVASDYKLLLNTDGTGNFATGTVVPVNATSFAGNVATFIGVNIPDNTVFTFLFPVDNSSSSTTTVTACNSYSWNNNNYTASGTYTYTTTNYLGCDSTATLNLTINPLPVPTINGPVTACMGSTGVSYSTEAGMTGYTWTISADGIITSGAGTSTITVNWLANGAAWVAVNYTNSNNCTASSPAAQTVTVIQTGQVDQPTSQVFCTGSSTTNIDFTTINSGGTTTYSWTNDTPSIGLPATGTGNIASFTAMNSGTAPVTAIITVTPVFTNGQVSCSGSTKSFTITVNPAAQVDQPSSQVVCNGSATSGITFTTGNTGGTTTYSWTNNTPGIGLAASGIGDISSFTAVNNGNAPVVATIFVTPTYTNRLENCAGSTETFTITVNPTAQVNQPIDLVVCNGSAAAVAFGTINTGGATTYSWTNTTTSIGLAAGGNGNISSFIAINTGNAPVVATITVTPSFTHGSISCLGPIKIFTIIVNPTGQVNQPVSQVVCNNASAAAVHFTTTNTGGTTSFAWANNTPVIGLDASGRGNVPTFTAVNSGVAPLVATISVIPTFMYGSAGCDGPLKTYTITANPSAHVNQPTNQVVCNNTGTTAIIFSTNNAGGVTSYTWTNDNPGIGLAGSGNNNIASFTAINAGTTPIVATITVTPTFTNGSASCTGSSKTFTLTVNPTAQVNQPANQQVCNGSGTAAVNFETINSSGTNTYSWINDTPGIGLAASGSGAIGSFIAMNSGNAPIEASITVTPHFENGTVSCNGPSKTFTITVNPTGQVNQTVNQVVCNGSLSAAVTFGTTTTGGSVTYTWTNDNPGIGLADSGTGDIVSFTAINSGTAPVVAFIIVTPTFTNGNVTCPGPAMTFTITVNPTARVLQPADQVVCHGSVTTAVNFETINSGGTMTYSWTNNKPSIGMGVSGTGNIPVFTAINYGTAPVMADITVIPHYENGTLSCDGPAKIFTILVNPTGQVKKNNNQVLFNGSTTSLVHFETNNTGGPTTYSWTNTKPSIGLAAGGTGDIPAFTAINTGIAPVIAIITVTPTFNNGTVGCVGTEKTFTITVNPVGQANQPGSQYYCDNSTTTEIVFTNTVPGGITRFDWTNDTPGIGLAASGTGNIPSFTTTNGGTDPLVATIIVVPTLTMGGISTQEDSIIFHFIINPTGQVNQLASQVVCNLGITTAVNFTTMNSGGTTSCSWTNDTPGIGLTASGSGNIGSFTAFNAGAFPIVATITVTPVFTSNGISCTGPVKSFLITVNPTGEVNQPASQVICNNTSTDMISFGTTNTGGVTSYTWTNDTPGIGLAASGNGDIGSFTSVNTGTSPVVATITVTPSFTHGSVGCAGPVKTFSITVNPTAQVNQPPDQVICNGSVTSVVSFGTANNVGITTYSWINDTPGIGLSSSGSGNIASFTAVNNGNDPIVATIMVTPSFTNGSISCTGQVKTFIITVNPTAQVNQPASQVVCNGSVTSIVNFATSNTGGIVAYTWTNNNISIGLGEQGSGNIPAFIAANTGTTPAIATIVVTPAFTNGSYSCTGPSKSFTITVNPASQVNQPADQVVCNNSSIAPVNFGTNNSGGTTTFSWTNNNTGIGLAQSGTGNIPVFTAINYGTAPAVATIVVTPHFENAAVSCDGPSKTFTIAVNPTGHVKKINNQALFHGFPTLPVHFETYNTGGTTVFTWTNNKPDIGLAANGAGDIPSFNAINTGISPVTAKITVTPTYNNGLVSCVGPDKIFTITVNPLGQVIQPDNQVICNNANTTEVIFTNTVPGGTTTFDWTNDAPGIGLAASGTGNIPSFTALDGGTDPVVATIVVSPTLTIGGISTLLDPVSFTITVNPTGQVNQPANQVVCNGSDAAVIFETINSGGTTSFAWTNNQTSIGLGAQGMGNIPAFTTVNTGTFPVEATIVVTPTFTSAGVNCQGTPKSFMITVNPTAGMNQPVSQVLCNNSSSVPVIYSTANTGGISSYTWMNSATGIGLAASGSDNIASFTAVNAGTAPIVATITATPTFTNGGISCLGGTTTFTITVNPTGQVDQPANQVVCNNAGTLAINFATSNSGGQTSYTWTNDIPGIGLAASGSGNIASFTATNTGNEPVVATITVMPTFSNGGMQCAGQMKTFTITVNPTAQVNQPPDQVLCNTFFTAEVGFGTTNTGGVTSYTWTNDTPGIGLAASGSGNIPSFAALNTGTTPLVAIIMVTPNFINSGVNCTGPAKSFIITVNPNAQMNQPGNQVVCNDANTEAVNFVTTNSGGMTSFYWTNDNPSIGLASSGSGNIPSFKAVNVINAPIMATITVTPTFANGSVTCVGSTKTFTITVNPTAQVVQPTSQVVCNGSLTTPVNFTTTNTGGTMSCEWFNDTPGIGLAAAGTGDIASFTAINNGTAPVIATIVVQPSFTSNGVTCTGPLKTLTITVNPTAQVNQHADQVVCNGSETSINFGTINTGGTTTYIWINDNPGIGLGVLGIGNIPVFTAINNGTMPIEASINVYPFYENSYETCDGPTKTFTITVNPSGQVNHAANQVVCNNTNTAAISFTTTSTGGTTSFAWTNNNTSIGLGAYGTGDIPAFVAMNPGTSPVMATIEVTPAFTNGQVSCTGPSMSFTITVNPTAQANQSENQVVCNGSAALVNFSTINTGGTTTYEWTNTEPGIGLGAQGTGNIQEFIAVNAGTSPIVATIIVTPTFTNGQLSCTGPSKSFTITVNPSGQVNQVDNHVICNNETATLINFGTMNSGGTTIYTWTNDNTNTGLGAQGTGDIPAFIATNTGTAPVVATIVVIPTFTNGGVSCSGPSEIFSITVNPTAQVNQPGNQIVCNGLSTMAVTFTTTGTGGSITYGWTNDNTDTGLGAQGTGDIPAFIATNTGTAPEVSTIVVTPTFTNGSVSCTGPPKSFTITVKPLLPVSVSIVGSASNVCAGSPVTFTATAFNGGSVPSFQWKVNNINVGTNNAVFTYTPENGDVVSCVLISSEQCTSGNPALSNMIYLTVNPTNTVSIVISPTINPVCENLPVTFTAYTVNWGTSPSYQWKLNGANVGTDYPAYTYTPQNNDVVSCILTSNVSCPLNNPATSNDVVMTVNPLTPASLTIVPSANPVCAGTTVTYTATPVNGGTYPGYQWKVNGINAGTSEQTFTYIPVDNDMVTCEMTSYATCPIPNPSVSNTLTMTVNPLLPVSVTISASANTVCAGTEIIFTAQPTNGGTSPMFQWKVNGNPVGTNSAVFTYTPANNDLISCVMTSGEPCASGNPATSNILAMTILPIPLPAIDGAVAVCAGSTGVIYKTDSGMSNYTWGVSPGGIITAGTGTNEITVTWNSAGTQMVFVNYVNSQQCTAQSATVREVTVHQLPMPAIMGTGSVCSGTTGVNYTTEPGMTGYTWIVSPGGTITSGTGTNEITVAWHNAGAQTVSVNYMNINQCAASSATVRQVAVNPLPVPTINGLDMVCAGTTGLTYSTEPGMTGYLWNISAGGLITAGAGTSEITVYWSQAGVQTISVNYVNSNQCTAIVAAVKDVMVNVQLPVSLSITTPISTVCNGTPIVCTATPVNEGNNPVYQWKKNGLNFGYNSPTFSFTPGNGDIVTCELNSGAACATPNPAISNPIVFTVRPVPSPVINGTDTICVGIDSVVYYTETGKTNYTWSVSSGGIITFDGGSFINVTWNAVGQQFVTLNYSNTYNCDAPIPTIFPVKVIAGLNSRK